MDKQDWILLKALEKGKSFTAVAERLFISQPALSYRIKSLEQDLGVPLLLRSSKGVVLTDEGIITCQYADEMLRKYEELLNVLSSSSNVIRGILNIAVSPAIMSSFLPDLLCEFNKLHPLIEINIRSTFSSACVQQLMNDDVQIIIVRGDHKIKCKSHYLGSNNIIVISHDPINKEQLTELPYIKYETDATLERDIYNWWNENFRTPPRIVMRLNDSNACREMVNSNLGFSILPSVGEEYKSKYQFNEFTLQNKDGSCLTRNSWIMYKDNTYKIGAAKAFIEFVKDHTNRKRKEEINNVKSR